jgi:hypothetical protein
MNEANLAFKALATFGAMIVGASLVLALVMMALAGLYVHDRWVLEQQLDEMKKSATLIADAEAEEIR